MPSLPMRERGLKSLGLRRKKQETRVVPHAGAWIEIVRERRTIRIGRSLPSRERGLKWEIRRTLDGIVEEYFGIGR